MSHVSPHVPLQVVHYITTLCVVCGCHAFKTAVGCRSSQLFPFPSCSCGRGESSNGISETQDPGSLWQGRRGQEHLCRSPGTQSRQRREQTGVLWYPSFSGGFSVNCLGATWHVYPAVYLRIMQSNCG